MMIEIEEFNVLWAVVAGVVGTVVALMLTWILTSLFMRSFNVQALEEPMTVRNIDNNPETERYSNLTPQKDKNRDTSWDDFNKTDMLLTDRQNQSIAAISEREKGKPLEELQRGEETMGFQVYAMAVLALCAVGMFWFAIYYLTFTADQMQALVYMWLLGIAIDIPLRIILCLFLAWCRCDPPYRLKFVIRPQVTASHLKNFKRNPYKSRDPLLDGLQEDDIILANAIGPNTPRRHPFDNPTPPLITPADLSFAGKDFYYKQEPGATSSGEFYQNLSYEPEGEGSQLAIDPRDRYGKRSKKLKFRKNDGPIQGQDIEIHQAGGRYGTPTNRGGGGLEGDDEPLQTDSPRYLHKSDKSLNGKLLPYDNSIAEGERDGENPFRYPRYQETGELQDGVHAHEGEGEGLPGMFTEAEAEKGEGAGNFTGSKKGSPGKKGREVDTKSPGRKSQPSQSGSAAVTPHRGRQSIEGSANQSPVAGVLIVDQSKGSPRGRKGRKGSSGSPQTDRKGKSGNRKSNSPQNRKSSSPSNRKSGSPERSVQKSSAVSPNAKTLKRKGSKAQIHPISGLEESDKSYYEASQIMFSGDEAHGDAAAILPVTSVIVSDKRPNSSPDGKLSPRKLGEELKQQKNSPDQSPKRKNSPRHSPKRKSSPQHDGPPLPGENRSPPPTDGEESSYESSDDTEIDDAYYGFATAAGTGAIYGRAIKSGPNSQFQKTQGEPESDVSPAKKQRRGKKAGENERKRQGEGKRGKGPSEVSGRRPKFEESGKAQNRRMRSYPLRRKRGNDSSTSSEGMQTPRRAKNRRNARNKHLDDIHSASESEISIIEPVNRQSDLRPHKKTSLLAAKKRKNDEKERKRKQYADDIYARTGSTGRKPPRKPPLGQSASAQKLPQGIRRPESEDPNASDIFAPSWQRPDLSPYAAWEPNAESGDANWPRRRPDFSPTRVDGDGPMFGGRGRGMRAPMDEDDLPNKGMSPTGVEQGAIFFPGRETSDKWSNLENRPLQGAADEDRMNTMRELLALSNEMRNTPSKDAKRLNKILRKREKNRKQQIAESWLNSYDHPYKELQWLMIRDEERKKKAARSRSPNKLQQSDLHKSRSHSNITPIRHADSFAGLPEQRSRIKLEIVDSEIDRQQRVFEQNVQQSEESKGDYKLTSAVSQEAGQGFIA